jgi:hypothetical protein
MRNLSALLRRRRQNALFVLEDSGLDSQALLEHAVLFLEILDHAQLTAVDPATLVLGSEAIRSRLRAIGYRSITFSPD